MNPPTAPLRALRRGDCIGVVAPAGPATPEALAAVAPLLAAHGFAARLYPGCAQRTGFLAGDDATRAADLQQALADDDVAAVFCLRGGYGSARLLDRLDPAPIAATRKPLVGYSDITALHALWCRLGRPSLHAPMPASDLVKPGREADAEALFTLLQRGLRRGDVLAPALLPTQAGAALHRGGVADGRLVGGNLSLVASLLGTPWAWPCDDALLFLEDVNEELYKVDRLLTQLRLAGVLGAVRGFVIGSFTEGAAADGVLAEHLLPLGKPLLAGWPAGHGTPNRPLPLGARVRLDADAGRLTLLQDVIVGSVD